MYVRGDISGFKTRVVLILVLTVLMKITCGLFTSFVKDFITTTTEYTQMVSSQGLTYYVDSSGTQLTYSEITVKAAA